MKQKKLSALIGLILFFSMVFAALPLDDGTTQEMFEITQLNVKTSNLPPLGVVVGDILYYQFHQEYDNPEDFEGDERDLKGVLRVDVTGTNDVTDMVNYMLYRPDIVDGNWDGSMWVDAGWDSRWYEDNFTYALFDHTFAFNTSITDMSYENATENTDQLIKVAFNSNTISSEYSDAGSQWHTMHFTLFEDNNASKPVEITAYVNRTTGLMTYFEQYIDNATLILELASFSLDSGLSSY
ncbi:hypothetical protein KAR91_79175, partial [Candidatus Pacearchaeota archaeon]|nr:hypothetical protein [Candidatus Pacearchaeota archaeon]